MIYKKVEIKVEGYQEIADLYTYILDNSVEMRPNRKRPVIVICPGGGQVIHHHAVFHHIGGIHYPCHRLVIFIQHHDCDIGGTEIPPTFNAPE